MVSIDIVEVTTQSYSREGSQIASTIDEKRSVGEIVFLGESIQKCSSWIGASPSKKCDIDGEIDLPQPEYLREEFLVDR